MGYRSAYGDDREITAAQYMAEMACERMADHAGATLPQRFWATTAWKKAFVAQIQAANRLLKTFDEEAVIGALRANPRIRSLIPKFFVEYVEREQGAIDAARRQAEKSAPVDVNNTNETPRRGAPTGKSVRGRLKDL